MARPIKTSSPGGRGCSYGSKKYWGFSLKPPVAAPRQAKVEAKAEVEAEASPRHHTKEKIDLGEIVLVVNTNIEDWDEVSPDGFVVTGCNKNQRRPFHEYLKAWPRAFGQSFFWFRARLRELASRSWREAGLPAPRLMMRSEAHCMMGDEVYLMADDDDFVAPFLLDEISRWDIKRGMVYYWTEHFTGCTNYTFFDLGRYGTRKHPHGDNQLFVSRGYPDRAKRKFVRTQRPLSLWSTTPCSMNIYKKLISYSWDKRSDWQHLSDDPWVAKLRFLRDIYVRNSRKSIDGLPRGLWFTPYWQETVDLFNLPRA